MSSCIVGECRDNGVRLPPEENPMMRWLTMALLAIPGVALSANPVGTCVSGPRVGQRPGPYSFVGGGICSGSEATKSWSTSGCRIGRRSYGAGTYEYELRR